MQHQATLKARTFAKTLRKAMTDGERKVWSRIRNEQLGFKFRRQHPMGSFIADFACLDPKLVVEIDGSQHAQNQAADASRDRFFRGHGFAVLRFAANLPMSDLHGVTQAILNALNDLSNRSPAPSNIPAPIPTFPQRGKVKMPNSSLIATP